MQRAGAIFLLILFLPFAVSADALVRRTTLLVRDMDTSVAFYQALGLKVWYQNSRLAEENGGVLGGEDLPFDTLPGTSAITILKGEAADSGMVGLLHYGDPSLAEARREPPGTRGLRQGDLILMISVDDVRKTHVALVGLGAIIHSPPARFEVKARDGTTRATGWRMFVFDPDGHLLELAQQDRR